MAMKDLFVTPLKTERERARIRRLLTIYNVTQIVVFVLVIAISSSTRGLVISAFGLLQAVLLLSLARSRYLDWCRMLTPTILFVVITAYLGLSGVRGLSNIAFVTCIIAAMVMMGRNAARVATLLSMGVIMLAWYLQFSELWVVGSTLEVGPHVGWLVSLVYFGSYLLMAQFYDFQQEDVALVEQRERELKTSLDQLSENTRLIENSEARYRLLAENIHDVVWVYTIDMDYVYCSPSVYMQRGVTPEDVRDIPLHQQMTPEAFALMSGVLAEELARDSEPGVDPNRTRVLEHEAYRKDGSTLWIESVVSFLRDENGKPDRILGLSRDITERRQAESDREGYMAQIQQMQKMESLGLLAGGIAHDFNNILLGVMGNADLALRKLPADSSARENVEQLVVSAGRAAELCNQLLAYSGKGRYDTHLIDISELVEDTAALLSLPIGQRIKMEYDLADNLPAVKADPSQLRQVALNLIFNAREAIGEEPGKVTLSTGVVESLESEENLVHLPSDEVDGPLVFLTVVDSGCGMDTSTRDRVFDPFFTTKEAGHGLGLSAVSGIVARHRGAVAIESSPGQGTRVTIYLPASRATTEREPEASDNGQAESLSGTVLVVDDEEVVRTFARHALEHFGVTVLTAENGKAATDLFERKPDAIDAVLLDMTMPVMGGVETLETMRQIRADIPIVLTSGYDEESTAQELVAKGEVKFIHKPYRMLELAQVLKTVLPDV